MNKWLTAVQKFKTPRFWQKYAFYTVLIFLMADFEMNPHIAFP
ncbi:MAG: hypothetical protein JG782_1570 [Anaerophaga sp.]|nr:hypothetical protein [Anaerophaga sp.]MDN5291608.1 hypothetical protein [Anaerophaga sp.]